MFGKELCITAIHAIHVADHRRKVTGIPQRIKYKLIHEKKFFIVENDVGD